MAKSKNKAQDKCRSFYRGPEARPSKEATEQDMQIIVDFLRKRVYNFTTYWLSEEIDLKLVIGLSATLRYLKNKNTKALVFDDLLDVHLSKYLIYFANHLNIPIIKAHGLATVCKELKLKSLLVFCVAECDLDKKPFKDEATDRFSDLLQSLIKPKRPETEFRLPVIEKVPPKEKKKAKRKLKSCIDPEDNAAKKAKTD